MKLALLILTLLPLNSYANSLARYECNVVDFASISAEKATPSFIERNLKKKYSIITTPKNFIVSMIENGTVFPPEELIVPHQTTILDTIAYDGAILSGFKVVAISKSELKGKKSIYPATITYTSGDFTNVWRLLCNKS